MLQGMNGFGDHRRGVGDRLSQRLDLTYGRNRRESPRKIVVRVKRSSVRRGQVQVAI